jgi:imidazolonepropionase-like amidohydrolase
MEAFDAIPDAAAMMHKRGVLTSINSDSADLARRLNTEGAKTIKHGGASPDDAMRFVTLNAAKQLRIDGKTGSLEAGKDADFVIWRGHPLSNYARVEQTWIEGRKYFDRAKISRRGKPSPRSVTRWCRRRSASA